MNYKSILEKIADWLALIGVVSGLSGWITVMVTWYYAWLSGDYSTIVNINNYGEALAEYYIMPVILILCIWGVIWYIHEAFVEKHEM